MNDFIFSFYTPIGRVDLHAKKEENGLMKMNFSFKDRKGDVYMGHTEKVLERDVERWLNKMKSCEGRLVINDDDVVVLEVIE